MAGTAVRGRPETTPHMEPMPCLAKPSLATPHPAVLCHAVPRKHSLLAGTDSQVDL